MRFGNYLLETAVCLSDYIFPDQCRLCGRVLQRGLENHICTWCLLNLPRTGYRSGNDHPAAQTFWGRCPFEHVMASLVYRRRNPAQRLIHDLKYHQSRDAGLFLGKLLGQDLMKTGILDPGNILIPVPLHPAKEKKRGYNQSRVICDGILSVCRASIDDTILRRAIARESQTRRGRFDRFTNSEGLFQLADNESLQGKTILLIDDVITTGATLEACAQVLSEVQGIRMSAAAVAFSSNA